jgi:hypothetical protein
MAAPHVAGAFAVVRGAIRSDTLTVEQIVQAMKDTGRTIPDQTTGRSYMRIDVDDTIERLRTPLPKPQPDDAVVGDFTGKAVVDASGLAVGTVIGMSVNPETGAPDRCLIDLGFQETAVRWVGIWCGLLAHDTTIRVAISTLSETDLHMLATAFPVP